MNLFRKLLVKSKEVKLKYSDESIAIEKIEKFCKTFSIFSFDSFEDYVNKIRRKSSLISVLLSRIVFVLFMMKNLILVAKDNRLIRILTNDPNYLMSKPRLMGPLFSVCVFTVVLLGFYFLNEEYKYNFYPIIFLQKMKRKTLLIKLSAMNKIKFARRINIFTDYSLKIFFPIISINVIVVVCVFMVIAYMDPGNGYFIGILIFWCMIIILWSIFFYSFVAFGITLWYLITLFLIYKFKEINELIVKSFKFGNKYSLINAIQQHNTVSVLTQKINKSFSVFTFIIYYFGTPGLQLILYSIHEKSSTLYWQLIATVLFITIYTFIFTMNMMSVYLAKIAHKPSRTIYKYLLKHRLPIKQKLKIQDFTEHLSGHTIGFYCLNMFPMNNYEFYSYLMISSSNYILFLNNL